KKNNPISLKKTWNQHYLWQLLKKHQNGSLTKKNHESRMEGNSIQLRLNDIKQQGVGSESLDGSITESMNRPGIKEDIYTATTPIGRQSVGGITNRKQYDQPGLKEDHNNEGKI
ncbi:hypothetical protein Tco_0221306, partial [Tanacetum coccineum]